MSASCDSTKTNTTPESQNDLLECINALDLSASSAVDEKNDTDLTKYDEKDVTEDDGSDTDHELERCLKYEELYLEDLIGTFSETIPNAREIRRGVAYRAEIKYNRLFLRHAMNENKLGAYSFKLPIQWIERCAYYGSCRFKDKTEFECAKKDLIKQFNYDARYIIQEQMAEYNFTDIPLYNRQNIHRSHYDLIEVNGEGKIEKVNHYTPCALCDLEVKCPMINN